MDKNEIMMTTEPQEERGARFYVDNNPQPAMPMKWFTFYKVVLMIWAVCYGIYGVLSVVLGIIESQGDGIMIAVFLGLAVLSIALGALCLYLFLGLRKYRRKAYKVNMWFTMALGIFSAAGTGVIAMGGIVAGLGIGGTIILGVVYALLGLIYPLCSIIYFEKRKFLFVNEKDAEPADVSEEDAPPANKSGLKVKYLIAHAIVSALVIALAMVLTPAEWSEYISSDYEDDYDYGFEYDYGLEKAEGEYEEVITDEAEIADAFDDIAVYLGYTDRDELMTEIEYIEEEDYDTIIDLHGMDQKEAYQYIFTEYFAVPDYEGALFAINPYTEEVITSFADYQDYVRMEVEAYFELYEEFE